MTEHSSLVSIRNLSSPRLLSPFRYPGGKTWLVPYIRRWIASQLRRPVEFFEPFAGGGIISLTVASEQLADHVTMVELDKGVAAVWRTILNGESKWLANRIVRFNLTAKTVETTLSRHAPSLRERAFQTILKNRVNRGGILAPGAGRLKQGESGKGMHSRWYPQTLRKRILDVVAVRDQITFIQGDGLEILRQNAQRTNALFFIDPPYTAAGKKAGSRLYTHHELDHDELFRLTAQLSGDFLMTYDDTEEVRDLARHHNLDVRAVVMKNTHHAWITELLIGRDLGWV